MPAHVHDRRMEAYLYIDLPETARAIHLMGEPDRDPPPRPRQRGGRDLAALVDPRRRRHLGLHLHLGDGRRQRRLQGRRHGGDGDPAVTDPFRLDGKVALVTGANTGIGQAIAIGMARAGAEVIAAGRSSLDRDPRPDRRRGPEGPPARARRSTTRRPPRRRSLDARPRSTSSSTTPASSAAPTPSTSPRRTGTRSSTSTSRPSSSSPRPSPAPPSPRGPAARSSTSPRSSPSRAASASPPTPPPSTASPASPSSLANEWAAKGINVNAIAPGYIETNNTEALRADPDRSKAILDRIPAGRWGEPEDIAGAAVFLASPRRKLRPRHGPARRRRLACPLTPRG